MYFKKEILSPNYLQIENYSNDNQKKNKTNNYNMEIIYNYYKASMGVKWNMHAKYLEFTVCSYL